MAQDKLAGIIRALVGVPQERLVVVQKVVNGLNSAAEHGVQFQVELSKFVLGWKPPIAAVTNSKFTPYLHPKQRDGGSIRGFEFENHLKSEGLYDRTLSLEDEVVKGWLASPSTYPEEFKGKVIFLWKSQQGAGRSRSVAYLVWRGERVVVGWYWLGGRWVGNPVLLASS